MEQKLMKALVLAVLFLVLIGFSVWFVTTLDKYMQNKAIECLEDGGTPILGYNGSYRDCYKK